MLLLLKLLPHLGDSGVAGDSNVVSFVENGGRSTHLYSSGKSSHVRGGRAEQRDGVQHW